MPVTKHILYPRLPSSFLTQPNLSPSPSSFLAQQNPSPPPAAISMPSCFTFVDAMADPPKILHLPNHPWLLSLVINIHGKPVSRLTNFSCRNHLPIDVVENMEKRMAFRLTEERWIEWRCAVMVDGWKSGADGWRRERRWSRRLEEGSWRSVVGMKQKDLAWQGKKNQKVDKRRGVWSRVQMVFGYRDSKILDELK